ncbi:hypothetical protein E4U41_007797, partial [Claviceps citrina]
MGSLFRLPDEELLAPLVARFPGREHQIRSFATLVHPDGAQCRNIVLYGTEATGKSSIAEGVLARVAESTRSGPGPGPRFGHAVVNAAQCITGRHLLERIVASVAEVVRQGRGRAGRCESLAQLCVTLAAMLGDADADADAGAGSRFVLVLDAVDRQRDAPPTLLPGLARLSEVIPSLTCVFIVTAPPAGFLQTPASAYLHFPPYTKAEFVRILALSPPPPPSLIPGLAPDETAHLWARFCAAVHDAL